MSDILQINWRYDRNQNQEQDTKNADEKYKLRASKKKTEMVGKCARKRGPKPKTHSAKMSKYRRKTANARERMRMGEINTAFDKLKDKIPLPKIGKVKCEKLTKINILHIAINYIRALEDILETGELAASIYPEKLIVNPFLGSGPTLELEETEMNDLGPRGYSPDSGIQEDSGTKDDHEEDIEDEDDENDFPDWTELNSTLDLRSVPPPYSPPFDITPALTSKAAPPITADTPLIKTTMSTYKRDLMSTSKRPLNTISSSAVLVPLLTLQSSQHQPVLSQSMSSSNQTLVQNPIRYITNENLSKSGLKQKSKPVTLTSRVYDEEPRKLTGQLVFKETRNKDLVFNETLEEEPFSDFLADFDSFEPIPDLDFSYEDPFRII